MIEIQSGYDPGDSPSGVPLIGIDNIATSVASSSTETGFPASNLLNTASHLFWKASSAAAQTIDVSLGGQTTNYLAVAKHNFGTIGAKVSLTGMGSTPSSLLLHFEGTNGSTQFQDSSGNDYGVNIAFGSPQIDTSQFKFGSASARLNACSLKSTNVPIGSSDYTVDFWVRISAHVGSDAILYDSRTSVGAANGITIYVAQTSHVVKFFQNSADRITGTTALLTGTWYHVAVTKSGSSTKLFINGTQEGSTYSASYSVSNTTGIDEIGGDKSGAQQMNGWIDEFRILSGTASWTANFTAPTAAYPDGGNLINGGYDLLLNFDGTDGSTSIVDSGGSDHVFTAVNGAQLDTAQFKFGTASCLFDGVDSYLSGDGSSDFDFGTGDFTIDMWARFSSLSHRQMLYDSRGAAGGAQFSVCLRLESNDLRYFINGSDVITAGTTVSINTWYHIALCRSSGTTTLYLNGLSQGTFANSNPMTNAANAPVIGNTFGSPFGDLATPVDGWIDQLRVIKGQALYTGDFVPNSVPISSLTPGAGVLVEDDKPLILRFSPTTSDLRLSISAGSDAAQASVLYAGELLVLERGVKIDVQHKDLPHARKTVVVNGMSESGNFLGRIQLSEYRDSKAEFAWFTPSWYRANFDPFVAAAVEVPFFWAWNPNDYPEDTAFAWLTEDVQPDTDPVTRRMAAVLSMRAIA